MPITAVPFLNRALLKVSFNNFYTNTDTLISKYHLPIVDPKMQRGPCPAPPYPEFFTGPAKTNYKKGTLIDFMFLSMPHKVSGFATGWQTL